MNEEILEGKGKEMGMGREGCGDVEVRVLPKSPLSTSICPDTKFPSSDLGTEYLKQDKNYLESESDPDGQAKLSPTQSNKSQTNLISQIKELQTEIQDMNKRILNTEEEMKEKDSETLKLKELLIKLKQDQGAVLELNEKESTCKSCEVI